ncbi:hypothetical protein WDJ51_01230 [Rathayibacter sp. YIM 133350]|uniref:hypothetical protein n=1 Tax=Rathayibacter sp. YIM 133350 TaxID=3131992 RepID=UPI00307D8EFD
MTDERRGSDPSGGRRLWSAGGAIAFLVGLFTLSLLATTRELVFGLIFVIAGLMFGISVTLAVGRFRTFRRPQKVLLIVGLILWFSLLCTLTFSFMQPSTPISGWVIGFLLALLAATFWLLAVNDRKPSGN